MGSPKKETSLEEPWKKAMRELAQAQKETDRQLKGLRESQEQTDRQLKQTDHQLKQTDRRFNSQWGKLVESLVEGDIATKFLERGIEVQGTTQRAKKFFVGKEYEFDIIVHNGDEIIVVEVKTTLDVGKVDHFVEKLKCFKKIFPEYADKKIYGAVAYIIADAGSDRYCQNQKLFVIRATGNSSTIVNSKDFRPKIF
ncbi:MAG: hypothetical protein OXB88_00245 [Bacteriovoracales bacterium]|nr:hypothetical protein [Bacteriovoracales bacterium]